MWFEEKGGKDTVLMPCGEDLSSTTRVKYYRPSGKVSLHRFIPLFLAGSVVAVGMAFVLLLAEADCYYFIFTPLVLSIPVFAFVYLLIRKGRCRLRWLAIMAGLFLVLLFYIGYWQLSYMAYIFVVFEEEPENAPLLFNFKNLWIYFQLKCETSIISTTPGIEPTEPDASDSIASYIFYSVEFLMFLFGGIFGSNYFGQRVFYEKKKKWASSKEVRFRPSDLGEVVKIFANQKWQQLAGLPKMAKTKGSEITSYVTFQIEYLKDDLEEPLYLSLKSMGLKKTDLLRSLKKFKASSFGRYIFQQIEFPSSCLATIGQGLPELGLAEIDASVLGDKDIVEGIEIDIEEAAGAAEATSSERKVVYSSGFKGWLEKKGIGAPRIEGPDFREKAAEVSETILKQSQVNEITITETSLCINVADEERCTPKELIKYENFIAVMFLAFLFLGFAILLTSAIIAEKVPEGSERPYEVAMSIGLGIALLCIPFILCSPLLLKRHMKKKLLNRTGALFNIATSKKMKVFRLEDSQTYHINKKSPDDICLCLFDQQQRRVLIEGCGHRYVVRGEDVVRLDPLESGAKAAIELVYKIGGEQLAIVLYREHAAKLVLNPLLTMYSAKRLLRKFKDTLGSSGGS
jgi:hypothetical protein